MDSSLAVVQQLCELAKNPANRVTIVRDQGCLPGLVLFLEHNNPEVMLVALQALGYLAESSRNRQAMTQETGMLESLDALVDGRVASNSACIALATALKATLNETVRKAEAKSNAVKPVEQETPGSPSALLGAGSKRARNITLTVDGLVDRLTRQAVEERLLAVKGVISFTFDMKRTPARIVIRCRADMTVDRLCHAISEAPALTAKQVLRNDQGDEFIVDHVVHTVKDENERPAMQVQPEYLPEEDAECVKVSKTALARVGGKKKQEDSGWFGTIGNFISQNLYW